MTDQKTVTQYPEIFASLGATFEEGEVKQRSAPGGRKLSYITARTAMNRLDEVLGPENWWDQYDVGRDNSMICKLSICLPDGRVVTKQGIGVNAANVGEDSEKGGESDSLKRAAAKFGVGRYLYQDGVPDFVTDREPERSAPAPRRGYDDAPPRRDPPRGAPERSGGGGGGKYGNLPRSGGALFAWSKKMEQEFDIGLIKYLDGWAKLQDLPRSWKEWSEEEVGRGVKEAVRKLDSISGGGNDQQQEDDEDDRPPF